MCYTKLRKEDNKYIKVSHKHTIEDCKKLAHDRGGKCLSKKYVNIRERMLWECGVCRFKWKACFSSVNNNGTWCPKCGNIKRAQKRRGYTIEECRQTAKEKGGECLSVKYINNKDKLKWRCNCGNIFYAALDNIKNRKQWCPKCGYKKIAQERRGYTIEECRQIAKERGGDCLSVKYTNNRSPLEWRCAQKHIFKSTIQSITRGSWCTKCRISIGENITRLYFEEIFQTIFVKYKPKWLKNRKGNQMELDGYSNKYKLAFEHQGQQHYRHIGHFHKSKKEFLSRKKDDNHKAKLCKKHKISLIPIPEIPTYLSIDKVKDFIINKCKKIGRIKIPSRTENITIDLKKAYTPTIKGNEKILIKIIEKKGGKLLSDYLGSQIKIKILCGCDYIWDAMPSKIISGNWCPECGRNDMKLKLRGYTIEDCRQIAKEREGKCLAKEYINSKNKLKWKCNCGNIFYASLEKVKNRKQWCPKCGQMKQARERRIYSIEDCRKIAKKRGGKCLSKKYIGPHIKLRWKCSKGHVWPATFSNIGYRSSWCPKCAIEKSTEKRKLKIEDMVKIAKKRGGKCLSKKYINAHTKLQWECKEGHKWRSEPTSVRNQGTWCMKCAINKRKKH